MEFLSTEEKLFSLRPIYLLPQDLDLTCIASFSPKRAAVRPKVF